MISDNEYLIRAINISKKFCKNLRLSVNYGLRDSFSRFLRKKPKTHCLRSGEFWAVENVSFDLYPGQCLAIMGMNGSGKTTLLRMLNNIYAPDDGIIHIRGQVGALIAAGVGFAPMLTGRENTYVNGSLLGMSRAEISDRMNDIIDFADIGDFFDSPIKHYSSGMQVRLGFAIAAMCHPDVLLIDEVLAVGDLNFQKNCYEYLHRLKKLGTAIIVVSHSIGAVWSLCESGIFLDQGKIIAHGKIEEIIRTYNDFNARRSLDPKCNGGEQLANQKLNNDYSGMVGGTGEVTVSNIQFVDCLNLQPKTEYAFGENIGIQTVINVTRPLNNIIIRFTFDAVHYKYISVIDSVEQGLPLYNLMPGTYKFRVNIPFQNFRPGTYNVNANICQKGVNIHLFFHNDAARFHISQPKEQFFYAEDNAILHLPAEFILDPLENKLVA